MPKPPLTTDRERFFDQKRQEMVSQQIESRGIKDPKILSVFLKIKRHLFVLPGLKSQAYDDNALPLDQDQTISQPYIVALMTELAKIKSTDKVLEIGTGSGYQTAVLAELANKVFSIEIINELAEEAKTRLSSLGYRNIEIRCANGYAGWPQEAPYDAIIVTAAAKNIPDALVQELKAGGELVIPVGSFSQDLFVVTKNKDGTVQKQEIIPVRFVPMVGGNDT
jgi:protein-L-isoaspartate(D-aspartate) O-methyltransferase